MFVLMATLESVWSSIYPENWYWIFSDIKQNTGNKIVIHSKLSVIQSDTNVAYDFKNYHMFGYFYIFLSRGDREQL